MAAFALLAAMVCWMVFVQWISSHNPFNARYLFDSFDLSGYLKSSRWVIGRERLYREVFSEYPLLANLLFGFTHRLALSMRPVLTELAAFAFLWSAAAWCLLVTIIRIVGSRSKGAFWIWLTPAAVYFSLYRFDVFPVFCSVVALWEIEQERVLRGCLWLGFAIALKG